MKPARNIGRTVIRYAHPVVYMLFPVLALYSSNLGQVLPGNLLRPAFLFLLAGLVLGMFLYFVTGRNVARAALGVSLFYFTFTSFDLCGVIFDALSQTYYWCYAWVFSSGSEGFLSREERNLFLLGMWAGLTFVSFYLGLRTRRDVTPIAWIAGLALIAQPLWNTGLGEVGRLRTDRAAKRENHSLPSPRNVDSPDLYVIVLDTYGRQDVLKSMYGLDNEPFLRSLTERGFLVARQSRANYIQTPLAIAAALNMDYLAPVETGGSWSQVSPSIDHNRIAAVLKQQGHRFISIPTGFDPTATPSADVILADLGGATPWLTPSLTQFEEILLGKTPLSVIPRTDTNGFGLHRKRILGAFDYLGEAASLPYPKFVFAHILSPHPPFVFCADGTPCAPVGQKIFTIEDASSYHEPHDVYRKGYAGQVQFVNRRILASLDAIQAKATRPYVIVLMGDHGARCLTDWASRDNTDVHEACANLFAVYCPPGQTRPGGFPKLSRRMRNVVTPVTGLRLVLNTYFGTDYPDLPDRSFYSTMDQPLRFEEVTQDLNTM